MNRRSTRMYFFEPGSCDIRRFCVFFIIALFPFSLIAQTKKPAPQPGTLKISFIHTVNGIPLVLNDSVYSNPFNETYRIGKLKYYISRVQAYGSGSIKKEKNSFHLLDAADTVSLHFEFTLPPGTYTSLDFLLGVDSSRNCSGAQTGALDPLNDMFWTWNSGYVMLKLEGSSPVSTQMNNRIEYHIGGYSGISNVIKRIELPAHFEITARRTTELIIESDIGTFWNNPNDITIAGSPVCTTPGTLAKKIADNYSKMFSLKKIMLLKN